jgi:hypothetical protein
MTYNTVEVELEDGRVRTCGSEALPTKARALMTFLDSGSVAPARTGKELAERLSAIQKLSPEEGNAFADDIEQSRAELPAPRDRWE